MASPILLILGAGANTGARVAQLFAKNGYKIALTSRSVNSSHAEGQDLVVKADFSDPSSIKSVFDEVKSKLGVPSVVIYNAAAANFKPDPISLEVSQFAESLAINTTSVYAAVKEAVAGFETLPSGTPKSFIYTGNGLNVSPMSVLLDLGVGKSATAHMIQAFSQAYKDKEYNFYYGDERNADGSTVGSKINGQNHADFYWELVSKKEQGPWDATFVGGKGYVDFSK